MTQHAIRTELNWSADASVVPWYEGASSDPGYVDRTVRSLQLNEQPAQELKAILEERAGLEFIGPRPGAGTEEFAQWEEKQIAVRSSAIERLRDWLTGRTFDVQEAERVTVEVPLFVLAAPPVPDCTATLAQSESTSTSAGLNLTLFGTGFEGSSVGSFEVSDTLTVAAGDTERVVKRIDVDVEQVVVLEHGTPVGRGTRIRPFNPSLRTGLPVLERVDPADLEVENLLCTFSLGAAAASLTHTRVLTYSTKETNKFTVGFKALGNDQSLSASIEVVGTLSVTASLKGAHEYDAYRTKRVPGVVWVVR